MAGMVASPLALSRGQLAKQGAEVQGRGIVWRRMTVGKAMAEDYPPEVGDVRDNHRFDEAIIGTTFDVMDFLQGRIFRDARLPGLAPAERTAVYDELNEVLARLHGVDYAAIGLGDYGRCL